MSYALWKGGIMHLGKVSTHVSLHSPHHLTGIWTFKYLQTLISLNFLHVNGANYNVIDSLPNDKILDWLKSKAFADNKIIVIEKMEFVLERVENTVGKEENAGYQHFFLFPQCFLKASSRLISRDRVVMG